MSKLFVFISKPLDTELSTISWYLLDPTKEVSASEDEVNHGIMTFAEFSNLYQTKFPEMDVSVVISGQYLTYKTIPVAIKNQRQMLQALPFMVEENVIGNIDDMHISVPTKWAADSIIVAVVDSSFIKNIIDKFEQYGLTLKSIFGLPDLLICNEGQFKILFYNNKVLFKGSGECFECDESNIMEMMELVPRSTVVDANISYVKMNKESVAIAKRLRLKLESDGLEVSLIEVTEDPLQHLLRHHINSASTPINLLQGEFNQSGSDGSAFERYSPILWAIALCLLIQISFNLVSGYYFNYHANKFIKQSEEAYLLNFPEEKSVKNVKTQLGGKLREAAEKKYNTGFSYLVTKSFLVMSKVGDGKNVKFNAFRYDAGDQELKIELSAATISLLDNLKEEMSKNGFEVKILSAKQEKDAVNSVLVIKSL